MGRRTIVMSILSSKSEGGCPTHPPSPPPPPGVGYIQIQAVSSANPRAPRWKSSALFLQPDHLPCRPFFSVAEIPRINQKSKIKENAGTRMRTYNHTLCLIWTRNPLGPSLAWGEQRKLPSAPPDEIFRPHRLQRPYSPFSISGTLLIKRDRTVITDEATQNGPLQAGRFEQNARCGP